MIKDIRYGDATNGQSVGKAAPSRRTDKNRTSLPTAKIRERLDALGLTKEAQAHNLVEAYKDWSTGALLCQFQAELGTQNPTSKFSHAAGATSAMIITIKEMASEVLPMKIGDLFVSKKELNDHVDLTQHVLLNAHGLLHLLKLEKIEAETVAAREALYGSR